MISRFGLEPWQSPICQPGDRFGRLVVLVTGKKPGTYKYMAVCQCDCGSVPVVVRIDALRKTDFSKRVKPTRSCGCLQKERATKHGLWQHPIFHIWRGMHERCYKPHSPRWKWYGAKGITVCDRWHNPQSFVKDMYPSYKQGLQLDRIDNNKGYSPDNCRWIDKSGQAQNISSNVNITYNGETHCLAVWSRIVGMGYQTLWGRLKAGWSVEKALTYPIRKR